MAMIRCLALQHAIRSVTGRLRRWQPFRAAGRTAGGVLSCMWGNLLGSSDWLAGDEMAGEIPLEATRRCRVDAPKAGKMTQPRYGSYRATRRSPLFGWTAWRRSATWVS